MTNQDYNVILYVMDGLWHVILQNGRPISAMKMGGAGEVLRKADRVWTLSEFCRRSGKSRRQIYRDIKDGKVHPLSKFLDDWLVEPAELARILPPPADLASLMPEYDLAALDLDRERELVLSRVLRFGGRQRLRWAFSFYGPGLIKDFVAQRCAALLDPRSARFWCLYFGVRAASALPSRRKGRRWGGAI